MNIDNNFECKFKRNPIFMLVILYYNSIKGNKSYKNNEKIFTSNVQLHELKLTKLIKLEY